MHAVRSLADFVQDARRAEPSPASREAALRCILDLMAAVIVGLDAPGMPGLRRIARESFGGSAPIWFSGATAGMAGAAWSNSAAAAALDLDDGNRLARGHPGAAVIPAVFAVASQTRSSLDEILKAIVVGYEVGVRVGAARRFYARSGMWTCHGVAAAAGLLRGTPPGQLAHAFAIAGATAPNLLFAGAGPAYPASEGNDVKEGIPWSTVTGLLAVLQAEAGLTGPQDVLDFAEHYDPGILLDGLGSDPYICRTYFKLYSCCRHVHAPVDALRGLIDRHGLPPERIEAVEVNTYRGSLRLANRTEPANLVDVQYSIPYCLGLAALSGPSALLPLTDEALFRDDVSRFARKVTLHLDPALDQRFPAETLTRIVLTCDGRRYESPVTAPRGEATDPLTWRELEEKFRVATRAIASGEQQSELLAAVGRLKDGDVSTLLDCLTHMPLASRTGSGERAEAAE